MSKFLTLPIPDEVDEAIRQAAARSGISVEDWATRELQRAALTSDDYANGLARLLRHVGTLELNQPRSSDNEQIDADLASCHPNS